MIDNVLNVALTVIPPQTLYYEKWLGNDINELGYSVPTYSDPVEIKGSVQNHITERVRQAYNLDMDRNYCLVNIPAEVVGIETQTTPDRLTIKGKKWIVVKCNNWYSYNGWVKLIVVLEKDYKGVEYAS